MSFKDMVQADNESVFMNLGEFAETHDIQYDGELYEGVSCVISQLKEQDRVTKMRDHGEGIYLVTSVFHCTLEALEGKIPEKGTKIGISDDDFMRWYYVAQAGCDLNMIRLELEAFDE